jgi:O-antigen/teichoic acid export membrane protein
MMIRRFDHLIKDRNLRLIAGFLDQGIVSLGSITYLICAAQFLSSTELGKFAIGVATLALTLSVVRAMCGETLLARLEGDSCFEGQAVAMLGLVSILAVIAFVLCLGVTSLWRPASGVFVATAFAVPGILFQDAVRYLLIARRDPKALLASDSAFVLISSTAIVVSAHSWRSGEAVIAAWASVSFVLAVLLLMVYRWIPDVRSAFGWFRDVWQQSSAFAVESILGALVGYTTVVVIAAFSSHAEVAAFRATISVFGVTSVATNFLRSSVLRELAKRDLADGRQANLVQAKMACVLVAAVASAATVLYLMPMSLGQRLLGDTWSVVAGLLMAGAVNRLAASASVVPTVMLRVLGVSWQATKVRIVISIVGLGFGPVGAYLDGAQGALYFESFTYILLAVLLSSLVKETLRHNADLTIPTNEGSGGWLHA